MTLLAVAFSFTIFGHKIFGNDMNSESIQAGDEIQKGTSITPDIQSKIKLFAEQAYIFNGNSTIKNILFIQQQLNNLYAGNWVVSIFGAYGNGTDPIMGTNFGISSYSTGGQWWIYWKGINHYQPNQAYYISKQDGNSTNYTCLCQSNYTYTSDTFKNVVYAAEVDFHDIQNYTAQIQYYLHGFNQTAFPTVAAVNGSIPFFMCVWGPASYNSIQRTDKLGLNVVSTPRVDY